MAINTKAAALQLVTILTGLSGMGAVQIGAPESVGPKVCAYVTMGGQQKIRKATAVTQRQARYFCMFAYRVDGAEATAETTLMDLVDAFHAALDADLTLNGTATVVEAESAGADEPDYQLRAGKEYREYPVVVTVTQQGSYTVNP